MRRPAEAGRGRSVGAVSRLGTVAGAVSVAALLALACVGDLRAQTPPGAGRGQPEASAHPTEMEAFAPYVGTWRAEDRSGADGRVSHFVYSLAWFDAAHSIVEMTIEEHFDEGEERLLWRGFKGWDSVEDRLYYHGFSPGGRAARGEVRLEGSDLVTEYDGWAPTGAPVRVRDIFTVVENDAFSGRTLVRATPEGDWREVSSDRWTRMDDSAAIELQDELAPLHPLLGSWVGDAAAAGRELHSIWTWSAGAAGGAVLGSVEEAFDGGPLEANMLELIGWDAAQEQIRFSTLNGRGGFSMSGVMRVDSTAIQRDWTMTSRDGSTMRGRDRLDLVGPDRIRWTQEFERDGAWEPAVYSPFWLERVGGRLDSSPTR